LPRGWFDIALLAGAESPGLVDGLRPRTAILGHFSQFIIAEADGEAAAALCAVAAAGTGAAAQRRSRKWPMTPGSMHRTGGDLRRGAYTPIAGCRAGDGDWLIEHVAT